MRVHPGLLLLVLLISFAIIPPGASASSSATLTITGEVVNPAPQDGDGGGREITGGGGGGDEGPEVVSAPNAVEPASQPAAPPSGGWDYTLSTPAFRNIGTGAGVWFHGTDSGKSTVTARFRQDTTRSDLSGAYSLVVTFTATAS